MPTSSSDVSAVKHPRVGLRLRAVLPVAFVALLSLAGGADALAGEARRPVAPSGFEHFVTRQGNRLFDGDREFRFVGANMPGLVLPYDYTLSLPERLTLPTPWEQEDAFKSLQQMNARVVRLWNLPIRGPKQTAPEGAMTWHYVQAPGQFNAESFRVIDNLLALANRYGIRVMFDFTAEYGDYLGGIGTYAEHRGKKREEFWTDPQLKADYQATIAYVLNRINTLTGIPYREDKAILAWQFGNEMQHAPPAWLAEMAAYIKSLDRHHLIAETRHMSTAPQVIDPNIDLYTRHYYPENMYGGAGWAAACRRDAAELGGQRPFFIGEFGPYVDGKNITQENAVPKVRAFLDAVIQDRGVAGALLWSMYFHHRGGGYYWHQIFTYPSVWAYHWPGFPSAEAQQEVGLMTAWREAAFRIDGREVPPVAKPDAPELLPIEEVPLLSWRGSAGATGYDIERAPRADGPWATLDANVSDADIAYRPLYSDTQARTGETWFYRLIARNSSGVSPPSNVVGPVRVAGTCWVDELQDFSRARARSEKLRLNNAYNARYAEYLFRAQGEAGDRIAYEVPLAITTVKVTAFLPSEAADLVLEVSAAGQAPTRLPAQRSARSLSLPPGKAGVKPFTLVTYEAAVPAGCRQLVVRWQGPAELDRVEIRGR